MKSFKRNIIKTLVLGAAVAMTCSCEDFLTIYPTDKVVLENYWKTKTDVENVVANSYRKMIQSSFTDRLVVWGELRGDNVILGNNPSTNVKNIMEANLLAENGYNDWSHFYSIINNCNIVMKYAPEVMNEDPDFTQGDLDVTMGEMLAIRALCHFYLVRTFRDIPLLKEAMVDDSQNLYQAQATPLEALDFILDDLYKAEGLVMASGNYPNDSDNKGRMTKNAVRAIIADALLWKAAFAQYAANGDDQGVKQYYTECIAFCDSALNDQLRYNLNYEEEYKVTGNGKIDEVYPLEHQPVKNTGNATYLDLPYYKVFYQGNNRRESIFELQHAYVEDGANYHLPNFYGYDYKVGQFSAPRYFAETGTQGLYKATDYRRVSNVNIPSSGEVDMYPIIKGTYRYASGTIDKPEYPANNKLSVNSTESGSKYFPGVNTILYRTSDVMLMKAEALALRNDTVVPGNQDLRKSFELVKAVYYRSNPYKVTNADSLKYSSDAGTMQALVLEERQRELAFEGKRWYDLVRKALRDGQTNDMLDILVDHKYETNQKAIRSKMAAMDCLFFPIYQREIETNPLLKQNPAYEVEDLYEKK